MQSDELRLEISFFLRISLKCLIKYLVRFDYKTNNPTREKALRFENLHLKLEDVILVPF